MRVTCKHCGGPHPAFECRKKSGNDRAAEPAVVPRAKSTDGSGRNQVLLDGSKPDPYDCAVVPSVDTNSAVGTPIKPRGRVQSGNKKRDDLSPPAVVNDEPDKLGVATAEGRTKFDKKAWQREYMREYMRKRRAAK